MKTKHLTMALMVIILSGCETSTVQQRHPASSLNSSPPVAAESPVAELTPQPIARKELFRFQECLKNTFKIMRISVLHPIVANSGDSHAIKESWATDETKIAVKDSTVFLEFEPDLADVRPWSEICAALVKDIATRCDVPQGVYALSIRHPRDMEFRNRLVVSLRGLRVTDWKQVSNMTVKDIARSFGRAPTPPMQFYVPR